MGDNPDVKRFIAQWRDTGGSELANTQSFINGLCQLIGVEPPHGSRTDDSQNDYVFERRVFQDNGDGSVSFGRVDCYKRGAFILEAKQGSEADRAAAMISNMRSPTSSPARACSGTTMRPVRAITGICARSRRPYGFTTPAKLLEDFWNDVDQWRPE